MTVYQALHKSESCKSDLRSLKIRCQDSNHYSVLVVLLKIQRLLIMMQFRFQQTCFKHHNDSGLTSNYG